MTGSQFWVIDTDTPGMSQGTFTAIGPFQTQAKAESYIIEDTKSVWEDSCTCLTSDKSKKWQKPSHIVQVIRTVEPEITANVVLVDTANVPDQATAKKGIAK